MNFHNNASQILKVRPLNIALPQKQKTLKKLLILKVTFSSLRLTNRIKYTYRKDFRRKKKYPLDIKFLRKLKKISFQQV